MIDKEIANKVLTIGPSFKPVEGGIAQGMEYYDTEGSAGILCKR